MITELGEKINYLQPEELPGVEILSVDNGQRLWRVLHQTYTICTAFGQSQADIEYRGKRHSMSGGELLIVEPGNVHNTRKMTKGSSFRVIQIDPQKIGEISSKEGLPFNPHMRFSIAAHQELFRAFTNLHRSYETEGFSLLEKQSRFSYSLGLLLHNCTEKGKLAPPKHPGKSVLRQARDYIMEHRREKISLNQLSEITGLSQFHFLRAFKREFGIPPHTYQILARIEEIKEVLRLGTPLDSIETGFSDQSHFIRHFKRLLGVTPGQYLAMITSARLPAPHQ
jgi:AraC-like DNA-binding protein